MMRAGAAILMWMLGAPLVSRAYSNGEVVVRLVDEGQLRGPMLIMAKRVAASILDSAGVTVRWARGSGKTAPDWDACTEGGPARRITIGFTEKAPGRFPADALAAALPFADRGTGITVFMDRILPRMEMSSRPEILLGHILAHEIGHVLMRTSAHAASGLMKAHWSQRDIQEMTFESLQFTSEHAAAMRENVAGGCLLRAARHGVN